MRTAHGWTAEDARRAQAVARQLEELKDAPGIDPWDPVALWAWAGRFPVDDPRAEIAFALLQPRRSACSD